MRVTHTTNVKCFESHPRTSVVVLVVVGDMNRFQIVPQREWAYIRLAYLCRWYICIVVQSNARTSNMHASYACSAARLRGFTLVRWPVPYGARTLNRVGIVFRRASQHIYDDDLWNHPPCHALDTNGKMCFVCVEYVHGICTRCCWSSCVRALLACGAHSRDNDVSFVSMRACMCLGVCVCACFVPRTSNIRDIRCFCVLFAFRVHVVYNMFGARARTLREKSHVSQCAFVSPETAVDRCTSSS